MIETPTPTGLCIARVTGPTNSCLPQQTGSLKVEGKGFISSEQNVAYEGVPKQSLFLCATSSGGCSPFLETVLLHFLRASWEFQGMMLRLKMR